MTRSIIKSDQYSTPRRGWRCTRLANSLLAQDQGTILPFQLCCFQRMDISLGLREDGQDQSMGDEKCSGMASHMTITLGLKFSDEDIGRNKHVESPCISHILLSLAQTTSIP